jgi:hypothetical protein
MLGTPYPLALDVRGPGVGARIDIFIVGATRVRGHETERDEPLPPLREVTA